MAMLSLICSFGCPTRKCGRIPGWGQICSAGLQLTASVQGRDRLLTSLGGGFMARERKLDFRHAWACDT